MPSIVISWTSALVFIAFLLLIQCITRIGRREAGLPPGPPTIPILGNATQLPREHAYLRLTEWAKQYGGIYSLKVLSSTILVITDLAAVHELLDKRSASSSDRPASITADAVTGAGNHLALSSYNTTAKLLRRLVNDILSPTESKKHLPIQKAEIAQLLNDLLHTPEDLYGHLGRFTNSIIMSIGYGIRTPRHDTKHAADFYAMEERWSAFLAPGSHNIVDFIPILRYVPERWALWKTEAQDIRKIHENLYFGLLTGTETRLGRGEDNGSFMESVLKKQEELQLDRELIGYLGGVLIEGGSETAASFLRTLILAFVENPTVLRKAQEELDRIVGEDRIPTIDDAAQLPFVHAIIKEVYRFRPMAPVAIPHALASDELYLNYRLPKGATLLMNVWGIFHDPEIFDEPDKFNPDRYILSEYGTKPDYTGSMNPRSTLVFGAGRRLCPGMHVANNTLLLAVMNLVWAFDFQRPLDKDENPIALDAGLENYSSGLSIQPNPYHCRIIPRSQMRAALIKAEFRDAREVLAKFEQGVGELERV